MDKTLYARDISSLTWRRRTKSPPDGQERVEVAGLGRGVTDRPRGTRVSCTYRSASAGCSGRPRMRSG
jgi:hypothetical protein